jgi:hypothetical protein
VILINKNNSKFFMQLLAYDFIAYYFIAYYFMIHCVHILHIYAYILKLILTSLLCTLYLIILLMLISLLIINSRNLYSVVLSLYSFRLLIDIHCICVTINSYNLFIEIERRLNEIFQKFFYLLYI